jgi:pyruvate kinase
VVKIEKPQAVRHLEAIVAVTNGVMVARGDLGVEMDVQRVPAIQKRVIALCNQVHRPVITATQMLNSMEHSSRPTRAEASDVFNAVLDGTDAVMLSGETAVGEYPVEVVATMRQICAEAEAYLKSAARPVIGDAVSLTGLVEPITEAAVDAACSAARELSAPLIVVATESGRTALALSNRRPTATILALTRTEGIARTLTACWGVTPIVQPDPGSAERDLSFAIDWAASRRVVQRGQYVVLVRGQAPGEAPSRAVLVRQVS